jgi:hypothetical protein
MEACAATATIRQYRKPKWRLPFNVMMRAGDRKLAEPLLIRLQEPAKTSSCQSATFFWQAREELYWEPNPMSRADEFRKNADECRQKAAKAFNPLDKERWLKIAEHWLLMAQEADAAPDTRRRR